MKNKTGKIIGKIICTTFIIWLVASYIDIISHNMSDYIYQWWNVFTWMP